MKALFEGGVAFGGRGTLDSHEFTATQLEDTRKGDEVMVDWIWLNLEEAHSA